MKKTHRLRLMAALGAGMLSAASLSSCAGMWFGTDTDFNFTQPGGFGIDIGVSSPRIPIGGPGFFGPGPDFGPYGGPGGPGMPPPPPPY